MARFRIRALLRERVAGHSMQQIFSRMYRNNSWSNPQSASGDGSDMTQTAVIRRELPALVKALGVRSFLDAPCGDYFWMKTLNMKLERYIGADIVPDMIAENQKRFASDVVSFTTLDVTADELPRVDLIMCRDCLVHLPLSKAQSALRNFKRSGSRYLLTTTYPGLLQRNKPLLITGNWRPLDLTLPPFSLPAPVRVINEGCTEIEDHPQKSLGLWDLSQVQPEVSKPT